MKEADKEKAGEILFSPSALDYMSSEESDGERVGNGAKPRKRIRLSWERTKLRNLKAMLDTEYSKTLTGRQKLTAEKWSRAKIQGNFVPPLY